MSLLSEQEKREIRDAIRSVTDTFMVTPLVYCISTATNDRWAEDEQNRLYSGISLQALVEYPSTEIKQELQGTTDDHDIKLTFNLEYLQELLLITNDFKVKFDSKEDFFVVKQIEYKVTEVSYDGPLDAKDVLVIVKGEKRDWTNQLDNVQMITDGSGL